MVDVQRAGRGFYFHSGETVDAVLEGLTIKRGDVSTEGPGIYINQSSPTIRNCRIEDNRIDTGFEFDWVYGGGIYCFGNCAPVITGCVISNNLVRSGYMGVACGGGIYSDATNVTITGCTISGNTSMSEASSGGGAGIYLRLGNPTVSGCTISGNDTYRYGGGIYVSGCEALIENCQITDNESWYPGGAVYSAGSGTQITGCTITGNSTRDPGTIWLSGADAAEPRLSGCIITNNQTTEGKGGAVYCYFNAPEIRNCLIADNQAYDGGGGIVIEESDPRILNCTIAGNVSTGNGGGIYCTNDSFPTVTNSILYYNQAAEGPEIWMGGTTPATLSIQHSNVMGGERRGPYPHRPHTGLGRRDDRCGARIYGSRQ